MNAIAMQTELGQLVIKCSEKGLTEVMFDEAETNEKSNVPLLNEAVKQLSEYFSGTRKKFELALDVKGTAFQHSVWQQLANIPFGETRSYQDIAKKIGNPKAVRAVGMTNGKNPIAIIVPCHRVIGKNGTLTGYAGGLERKEQLLKFETSLKGKI